MSFKQERDPFQEMSDVSPLSIYCRICGTPHCGNMMSIFDEHGNNLQLSEKINSYLPITVSVDDELPLEVCMQCVRKLNVIHELIVTSLEVNQRFTGVFSAEKDADTVVVSEQFGENIEDYAHDQNMSSDTIVQDEPHYEDSLITSGNRSFDNEIKTESENKNVMMTMGNPSYETVDKDRPKDGGELVDNSKEVDIDFQGVRPAEFHFITPSGEEERNTYSDSPVLEPPNSVVMGTLDNDTELRNVETVLSFESNSNDNHEDCSETSQAVQCNSCEYVASSVNEITAHDCPNFFKDKAVYIHCKTCNEEFEDMYKYTIHKQRHTRGLRFACSQCDKVFSRNESLVLHQMVHVGVSPHQCKHCDKNFILRSSLDIHLANDHQDTPPWLCDQCGKHFSNRNNLRRHIRRHLCDRNYKCDICNKTFRTEFLLQEHMKFHDANRPFKCLLCMKSFSSEDRLKQHEDNYLHVARFQCNVCSVSFLRKEDLSDHYKTHVEDKVLTCNFCEAIFPSVPSFLRHRNSHLEKDRIQSKNEQMSLQCNVCKKVLSTKMSLYLHMRVHTGEKPHQCEVCNKTFAQKGALSYHMRLHTGERPHACKFCGKGFNCKASREGHERIHTGERPYKCGKCGLGFRCSANLNQHIRIHSDNWPYICEVCNKLFRRREALQVHLRVHTGERPYSCPVCERRFTQKGDMVKHTRNHSKDSKRSANFECLYCGQLFTQKRYYTMHYDKCSFIKNNFSTLNNVNEQREHNEMLVQGDETYPRKDVFAHGEERGLEHEQQEFIEVEKVEQSKHGQLLVQDDGVLINEQGEQGVIYGDDMMVDGEEVLEEHPHQVMSLQRFVKLADGEIFYQL